MAFPNKKLIDDPNGACASRFPLLSLSPPSLRSIPRSLSNSPAILAFFDFGIDNCCVLNAFAAVPCGIAFWIIFLTVYVVTEFIEGLVETYSGLQYLDGFPLVKVVLRADVSAATYDKVAIVSGVVPLGFCSECGEEVAMSLPMLDLSEKECLQQQYVEIYFLLHLLTQFYGIRAVTGPKGCLLIVKNYTGDRLNFGLAAEIAKSEGYKVEVKYDMYFAYSDCYCWDDCALPPPRGIAGRRGLAGLFWFTRSKHASEIVGTMGVALTVCSIPGQVASDRLGPGKMELGLGIHGEPGAAVADIQPVNVVVSHVLQQILSTETNYVPITRGERVVLMVNGLGATPTMELMIIAGKTVPKLQLEHGLAVDRVYTGSFMTSLDMAGFSISIMKADPVILQRLDAPTKAPYWPVAADGNHPPAKIPVPIPASRSAKTDEMYRGAKAILEDIKNYPLNDAAETVGNWFINWKIHGRNKWDHGLKHSQLPLLLCIGWSSVNGRHASTVDLMGVAYAGWTFDLLSGEILSTVPDPGAMAAATWYRAAALAVKAKYQS
ncbi:hypothetical protein JHK82_018111 [Glycine max]|nr:hypothetical protein JHK82_018111 [Glycine max]